MLFVVLRHTIVLGGEERLYGGTEGESLFVDSLQTKRMIPDRLLKYFHPVASSDIHCWENSSDK